MIELTPERIDQILHEETVKKEEANAILRSIYIRYMRLYEKYFADIDALTDETVAGLKAYHEETRSLVKYYYMDIPQDVCKCLNAFDSAYSDCLLGPEWHKYLFDIFKDFKEKNNDKDRSRKHLSAEFSKQTLAAFYEAMDYIFREGFGTGSQTAKNILSEISSLLFGKEK